MRQRARTKRKDAGMSLIELMFACFVIAVGMAGGLLMITMAIADNGRNKLDTTGTMLAQMVIEQINVRPSNSDFLVPVTDCAGNGLFINTQAGPVNVGNGAAIVQNAGSPNYGRIDWFAAAPGNNYSFMYTACDGVPYEVRWNVMQTSATGQTFTKLITVSARRSTSGNLRYFAVPVHLRTITGP